MDRRALIQVVSMGAAWGSLVRAQHAGHCAAEMAASPYQLRFLTAPEHALLQDLMDIILPADAHSPGARAARTADFADWMLAHSAAAVQRRWREDLKWAAAQASAAEAIAGVAVNESNPTTEAERFFVRLKSMTVDGFYTSEIGIQKDLAYVGNQYLVKYEGCTHPEHRGRRG